MSLKQKNDRKINRDTKTIGIYKNAANNINIILGSGILSIPKALQNSGFYPGLIILFLVCVMCDYVCVQLVKMAKKQNVNGYEKLAESVFGNAMYYVICVFCFLSTFGAMMGYSQLIHDSIRSLLSDEITNATALKWASLGVTVGLFFVIVMPFAYLRDLSSLSWMSILSLCTFAVVAVILIVTGIRIDSYPSNRKDIEAVGLISAFGTFSFAFVCTDSIFPVYLGLKDRTQKRWNHVMHLTVLTLGLLYAIFSSLCYFLIPYLEDYVLNSKSIVHLIEIKITNILLIVTLLLTYLTKVHVTRTYFYSIVEKAVGPLENFSRRNFMILHMSSTTITIMLSITLGIVTGDLMFIVSLTGLVTSTAIGYVVPVLILIKIKTMKKVWQDFKDGFKKGIAFKKRANNICNLLFPIFILLFGLAGFAVGVPLTIISYIKKLKSLDK